MLGNIEILTADHVARIVRALAEPVRVRLLRLCADQPTSVSELAAALGESEPNVSRQLKQLALAGLLRRVRRGQRVEYVPTPIEGFAAAIAGLVLAHLDAEEPGLRAARARLRGLEVGARGAAPRGAAGEWLLRGRLGRELRGALELELGRDAGSRRVLVRSAHRELLDALLHVSARLTVRVSSRLEQQALQAWAAEEGGQVQLANAREIRTLPRFDTVLEAPRAEDLRDATSVRSLIRSARSRLLEGGVLCCVVPYDVLESEGPPPQQLRALLEAEGFECLTLSPVEAEGAHLLLSRARLRAARPRASRSASLSA